jgi:hypothetical protein
MAWKIGFNSPGDVLMIRNTSRDTADRGQRAEGIAANVPYLSACLATSSVLI